MPIEPDLKDWTWVTERRCPECGLDGQTVSSDELAERLRETGDVWTTVLTQESVRVRRNDETWSPLEYACHLRDAFGFLEFRLQLMVAEDHPTFESWDQDALALELDYRAEDPTSVAEQLGAAVGEFADRLDSLEAVQWQRSGTRGDGAQFTIESLGRYALHESVHHLDDVEA